MAALGTLNICLKFPTFTFNLFQMLRFSPRILRFVDVSKCIWSQSRFYCFQANYVSHPHLVTALDFMYPFCSQSYGRTWYIPMCFTTCDVFKLFLSAISRLVAKILLSFEYFARLTLCMFLLFDSSFICYSICC